MEEVGKASTSRKCSMETVALEQTRASPQPSLVLLGTRTRQVVRLPGAKPSDKRQSNVQSGGCQDLSSDFSTSLHPADSIRSCSCGSPPCKPKLETRQLCFTLRGCPAAGEHPRSVGNACWVQTCGSLAPCTWTVMKVEGSGCQHGTVWFQDAGRGADAPSLAHE